MWILITFSGSLEPDLHRVLLSFLSARLLFNPRHRKTWVSLKTEVAFIWVRDVCYRFYLFTGNQHRCVTTFFYKKKKKATCYQLKSKKATKHPSRQQSFFLTNQEVDQRWQHLHMQFSMADDIAPRYVTGTKQPCPSHAQHLCTVSAKCALHQAPLLGVRAPARLPPRFTSQFGHWNAFHGVCCGTPGSCFWSAPNKARVRISLLLFGWMVLARMVGTAALGAWSWGGKGGEGAQAKLPMSWAVEGSALARFLVFTFPQP